MACQSTSSLINYQTEEAGMSLFLDNKFKGHQDIVVETEAEIFALSEDMQQKSSKIRCCFSTC